MVPTKGLDLVFPIQPEGQILLDGASLVGIPVGGGHPKVIHPGKRTEVEPVFGPYLPIELPIEVVKEIGWVGAEIRVVARGRTDDRVEQKIEVCPSGTEHEARLVFHNGAFHCQLGSDDADVAVTMVFPHVAVLHVDLQHGREPAAKARGKSAFGDGHVLHRIGVEHTEEAKQMTHTVKWNPVKQHQVLVRTASSDVQPTCPFPSRLHPWQQLKRLEQVHFPTDGRQRLDLIDGDFHLGHLHLLLDAAFIFTRHNSLSQLRPGHHGQIEFDIFPGQIDLQTLPFVANVGHLQIVGLGRKREGVKPIEVAHDAHRSVRRPHRRTNQGFSRGRICDVSTQGELRHTLAPKRQ